MSRQNIAIICRKTNRCGFFIALRVIFKVKFPAAHHAQRIPNLDRLISSVFNSKHTYNDGKKYLKSNSLQNYSS